jgi:signal transduction histidine kinase
MKRTAGLAALPRADQSPRESNPTLHRTLDALRDEPGFETASRKRDRIASALHDDVIQSVTSVLLELEALPRRFERDPREALATLEESKNEIRRSLTNLRSLLFELSGTRSTERPGQPLARSVEDVVKRWRLPATVTVEGNVDDVPPQVLSVAYVVIREALANVAKHASAGKVTVTVAANGGDLAVIVADGGKGFTSRDEQAAREAHHFGLDMLRRRVREVGGELVIDSTIGTGTRVMARLPFQEVAS